ncbi:MAG: hypothetical protein ACTHMU_00405 [Thermomicrobiales bacterium]
MATTDRLVHAAEDDTPDENTVAATVARLEAEMRGLRARLREVEAATGRPGRPEQAVAPTMPELLARVRALERRAGIVPGLAPLPECLPALPGEEPPPARGEAPRLLEVVVALGLLLAITALLIHPWGHSVRLADPAPTSPVAEASPAPLAAPAAQPGGTPGTPAGEASCSLGGAAPCGALPISATEHLPAARPGFHCGIILPPAGQECDQEGLRLP